MDLIEYIKRFIKFLAVSQVIGLFYAIKLQAWVGYLLFTFLIPVITGSILLYYFFKGSKMTPYHYLLGFLLYLLMGVLFFIPTYFGVKFFYGFLLWDSLYGISLILIIVGKRFLPPLMRYVRKRFLPPLMRYLKIKMESVSWESTVQELKNFSFRKVGIIVLVILVMFVSIRIWTGSRPEDRCRNLRELASEYGALIEDNRSLAKEYESKGEGYLKSYGDVLTSFRGAMASGAMMFHYTAKANEYAGKLRSIQSEMTDLGCK